ncbi:hypothetical protein D3C87_463080 [compost metagenome]
MGIGELCPFFVSVFQLFVHHRATKYVLCVARGDNFLYLCTPLRRKMGRLKSDNRLERKKFYFFLGNGKSFSTFALRFGGRGRGLKEGKRERDKERGTDKKSLFFIWKEEKFSYLCSPKRNGSYQTESDNDNNKI